MTHSDNPEENYLERLFWEFDAAVKAGKPPRDTLKKVCRRFAAYRVDNVLRAQHGFEMADEPRPL